MARLSPEEKLELLEQKKQRLLAEQRKLKSAISKRERNARTKRLIEIGATIESALGAEISKERLPELSEWAKRHHDDYHNPNHGW